MGAIVPVILCGGCGSRLWPASVHDRPKIFLEMTDGRSLLHHAMARARQFARSGEVLAVTGAAFAGSVLAQWHDEADEETRLEMLVEPAPRNTATAIAVAARHVLERFGGDSVMVCLPADHLAEDDARFAAPLAAGISAAEAGRLTLFGIKPDTPHTGYGYIEAAGTRVIGFHEKPDAATAADYVRSGRHFWNSGMVCARADVLLGAVEAAAPVISERSAAAYRGASRQAGRIDLPGSAYAICPDISFDHAVLERCANLHMIATDVAWRDVGSWSSYGTLGPADEMGNHVMGNAVLLETRNSIVKAGDKPVGIVGLENVIVVDTPQGLLVAHADSADRVRELFGDDAIMPNAAG